MARKLRVQYPGAVYHVMSRGDRREDIFEDDQDRQRLIETLAESCQKTGWQVHAYCLMRNHFHLVIETGNKLLGGQAPAILGEAVQEAAEAGAERLVLASLKRLKWTEKELLARRKGDAAKVRLAHQLRSQTTMPLTWIAQRLGMGSRGYLTWLLYRCGKTAK